MDWARILRELGERQRAAAPGWTPRDCDFCERKGVRCVALDHRQMGREDLRGEVTVEPAWMCIGCIKARTSEPNA